MEEVTHPTSQEPNYPIKASDIKLSQDSDNKESSEFKILEDSNKD